MLAIVSWYSKDGMVPRLCLLISGNCNSVIRGSYEFGELDILLLILDKLQESEFE